MDEVWSWGERLGRGGMGEVWAGVHLPSRTPVAFKVLTSTRADDPVVVDFLRHEMRAAAALDHPNVVRVLDAFTTAEGRPCLVLERIDGVPLSRVQVGTWAELRRVLASLLDALAHAHARGVVHNDVKPGNVLVEHGGRIKLVDFGLARLRGANPFGARSAGTPSYTAPEQLVSSFGPQGPWTDLYSLGCVAWRLATGVGPFQAKSWAEAVRAHLEDPVPVLVPRVRVPPGFEAWVRGLLAREPDRRPRRAADAAWALSRLDAEPEAPAAPRPVEQDAPTVVWTADQDAPTLAFLPGLAPTGPLGAGVVDRPPLPDDWRPPPRILAHRPGLGLGVVGVRAVPVVGREPEQDRLWAALRAVTETGRPRAVALTGPEGIGRTRLGEWLGHRAHEVGAAEVLVARHEGESAAHHGLVPAIRRHLGCAGLAADALEPVLARWLASFGADGGAPERLGLLVDLLAGRSPSRAERLAAVVAVLRLLARDRPLIVQLDDAHEDPEVAPVVEAVVRADRDPILFVLTTTADAAWPEAVERVPLEPLGAGARRELVRELLGFEGELAAEVEQRTGGHPSFVVQLVGDWVAAGVLAPTSSGFRLTTPTPPEVPASLQQLGRLAVQRVSSGGGLVSVELAALLGHEVAGAEWRAACAAVGVAPDEAAVDALVAAGLARRTRDPEGLAFAHGTVRDALVESAAAAGRAVGGHRACAAVVRDPTRRGLHLVAAGDDEAALEPLLESLARSAGEEDFRLALRPLRVREEAMARLGVPADDPRWGEGRLHRLRTQRLKGDWRAAEETARALVADAERHGWLVLVRARIELATVLRGRGRSAEALEVLEAARDGAAADGWLLGAWRMRRLLVLGDLRRFDEARAEGEAAVAAFEALDLPVMSAHALVGLSVVENAGGHPERIEPLLLGAKERYQRGRSLVGVANVWNNLGELARHRGDAVAAAAGYAESLRLYDAVGSGAGVLPRVNLGVLKLDAGDAAGAREILARGAVELEQQGRQGLLGVVEVARAAAAAMLGDGPGFDASLARAALLLRQTGAVDRDVVRWAERAATCWAHDRDRAVAALALARRHDR